MPPGYFSRSTTVCSLHIVYTRVQCDNGQIWHWITQQFNFSNVGQNSGFELFVVGRGGIVVEILHSR